MIRSLMTAALVLVLGLSAAGCGSAENASTAAHRWNSGQNDAQVQQRLARGDAGAERSDGAYQADDNGRVDGFRNGNALEDAGNDLMQAGEDIAQGAGDAARSIGNATENVLDGMTGTPKNSTPNHTPNNAG